MERSTLVLTIEEQEFPQFYYRNSPNFDDEDQSEEDADVSQPEADERNDSGNDEASQVDGSASSQAGEAKEGHFVFAENRKGVSYAKLFGPYVIGASRIVITDPYIRMFYQVRNLMEFIEMVAKEKAPEDEVAIHLVTSPDEFYPDRQQENLSSVEQASMSAGIQFSWEYDGTGTIHARHIVTDHGWKISLDRGLDIFQRYEMNDAFSLSNRLQEYRGAKAFEVTYLKIDPAQ